MENVNKTTEVTCMELAGLLVTIKDVNAEGQRTVGQAKAITLLELQIVTLMKRCD